MKVAVIGSREFDTEIEKIEFEDYLPNNTSLIVSGGAIGVDSLIEFYAYKKSIPILIFRPDYKRYGKKATFIRNRLIVKNADLIIAFWDGKSKGTKYTIDYANSLGKEVIVYNLNSVINREEIF